MLPFCQRYKTAPMSQRALISLGSRENYSFDGVPRMATLLTKHLNQYKLFILLSRMTCFFVLQARRRAGRVVNRKLSIVAT
jgi:hypothetical protein